MSPLTPHWEQPSHPAIQTVEHASDSTSFTTRSLSKVSLPPFAVFAKLSFPPCTVAPEPTYATVQMGKDSHLNLNSDLLYINHSCEPSLVYSLSKPLKLCRLEDVNNIDTRQIFDMSSLNVLTGPKGLQPGDELTVSHHHHHHHQHSWMQYSQSFLVLLPFHRMVHGPALHLQLR
ncbi:galactose-proton symport [Sarocladium implicatum]|nr:galactose-proton symport [Sarocladium implicatum]